MYSDCFPKLLGTPLIFPAKLLLLYSWLAWCRLFGELLKYLLNQNYFRQVRFAEKEIFGIWICDTTDCERIYKLLQNLVAECAKSPPQIKPSSESPNLLDLLSHSPEGQDNERNHASTKAARSKCIFYFIERLPFFCEKRFLYSSELFFQSIC